MQENGQEKYEFIHEKIKEKPLRKRRLLFWTGFVALMAALFGFVACLVFTVSQPRLAKMFAEAEETETSEPSEEAVTGETETQTGEATEQPEGEEEPESEPQIVYEQFTLDDYQRLQNEIYAIGKEANKSVVAVTGVKSNTDWFNNTYESKGQGSGILISDDGQELLILTEHKVISGAQSVYVTFVNDVSVEASVKKYDGNTGVTVLSVPSASVDTDTRNAIKIAELGNSLTVTQGTIAIAVGSPLGTNYSILIGNITSTSNVVSTVDANYSIFTTDIVGSTGGSGVLVNLDGEVVGLVTQGYGSDGGENTLTAIAISELKPVIEMLSDGEDIPYIGVEITTVTNTIALENDIPKGVYIREVEMDSPAMAAGLQSGDIITEIDGDAVTSVDSYETKLLSLTPGETATVTVQRQGSSGYAEIECTVEIQILE